MDTNSIVYRVKLDSKDMKGSLYELKDAYKELERAKKELENRNVGTNDADYRLIKSQMKDVQALLGLYYKGWKDIQEVVEKAFILPTNALEATLRDIEKKMKELSSTPEGMEALAELQAQQAVLVDTIRKRNLAIRNIEQDRLNLTKLSNQQLAESLKSAKAILAVETRDTEESKKRHDMALKHAMDVQKIQDKQAGKQNIDEAASVLSQKSADLTIGRIKEAGDTVSRYQKQLGEFFDEATGQRFAAHLDDAQRLLRERATQIAKGSVQATYDEMNKALPILRQMRSEELEGSDKAKLYDGWIAGIQQRAKHGAEVIADSANIMAEAGQLLTQSINNSVSAEKEALSVQQAQTKEQEAQVKHILAKEKAEERIDKLAKEQSSKQRAITKQRNIDLQSAQHEADEALAEDKKYRGTRTRAKNLTTQRDDAQRAKTDAEFNLLGVNRDIKNTEDELAKTTEERKEAEKKMLAIQATTIEGRAKINGMMTEEQAKLEVINNEQQRGIDLLKKKREEEEAFQNELTEIERNRTRIQSDMQSTQSTMEVLRKAKPDSRTATGSAVDVTRMLGEGGFVQKTWLPDIQKAGSQLDRIEAKFKSEGKQIPEQIGVWRGMLQKVYTELTDQERGLPARLRQSGGVMSKEVFDQYFKSVNTLLAQVNSDIQYAASGDGSMFGRYNTTDGLFKAVDKSTYSKQSLRGRRTRDTSLTQELIDDSIDPTFLFGQFEQAQKLTLSNLFRTFDPQKELINSLANGGKFDNFVERLRDKIQAAFDAKASGGFGKGVFDDYIGSLQQIMDFVKKIQDAGGTDLFASARAQIKKQIAENESAIDATTDTAAIDNHIKQNKQLRSMLDDLDRVEGKGEWGIEKKNAALKNMEQQIKSNQQELDTLDEKQKQVEAQRAVQVSIDKANGTDISSLQQRLQRMTDQATPLASKVEDLQSVLNGNVISESLAKANETVNKLQTEYDTEKDAGKKERLAASLAEAKQEQDFWKALSPIIQSRYDMESGEIAKLNAAKSKAAEEERKQTEELGKLQKSLSEEEYNRAKEEEQRYARTGKRKLASLQAQASDLNQQLVAAQSAVSDWLQKHKPEVLGEDSDWTKNYKKGSSQLLSLSREKGNEDLAILLEKVNSIDRMLNSANGATVNITSSVEQQIKTFEDQITNLKKLLDEFGDEIDEETQMSYETQIKSLTDKIQELRSGGSLNLSDVSTGAAGIKEQIQQIQTAHEKNVKIIEQWDKKDALILEKEKAISKAKQDQADAEKEIAARMNFQTAASQGSEQWLSEVTAYMETLDMDSELYKKLDKSVGDYNRAVFNQQQLIADVTKQHDDLQAKETEQEKHLKGLNDKLKEYNDIITNSDQVMADRQKALDRLNEKMELAKAAQDRLTAANQRLAEVNAVDPRAQAAAWAEEERVKALAEVKAAQDEVTAATNATAAAQEEYNRKLTEGGGVSINKLKESFDKLRDLYLNEGDANKTAEIKALMDRVQARIHQLEVTPALAFAETMAEVRNVLDRQAADQATIDAAHQHSLDLQEQSNQRLADMKGVMLDKEREMVRLNELEAQQKKKDEEWERRRQSRVEKLNAAQEAYDTAHNDEAIAEAEQERGKQLQLKERFKARYVRGQQLLESADNWEKISNAIGGDHGKLAQAQQKLATTEDDLIKSAYALGDQFHVINGEVRTMAAQHFSEKINRINDRLEELDAPVKLKYNKNSKSENYGRMEKVELEDPSALYSDTISAKAQRENEQARKVIQREVRRNMSRDRSISLAQTSSLEVQKMQENLAAMQREAEDIIVNRLQTDLQTALNGGGVRNGVSKGNVDRLIKLVGADGNGGLIGDVQAGIESFIKHEREYLEGRLDYQRQELSKAENLTDEQILERLTARPEAALEASQKQQRKWQKRLAKEDITDEERSKAQENLDKVERRIERIQTKLDTIKADPRQYWNDTVIEGYKSRIEGWDTQLKYLMDGKYEQAYASKIERLMKQEERSNKVIAEQAAILKRNRSAYQKSQDDIIRYSDDLEALQHKQINHLATYAANGGGEDADKRIKAQMDRFRAMYEDATTGKHTEDERYRNALFNEFADDQKRQQISKNVFSGIVSSGSKSVLNDLQMMYQTLFKTADKAGQQFLADSMHGVQDVMTEMRRRLQQNDIAYRETDQIRDDATRTERRKELYKEYLAIIKESNAQLEQYRSSVRFVYEAWQQSDTTAKATVQTEEQQRESLYQLVKQTKEHGEVLELDEKQTKSYNSMVSRSTERLQDNYDKRNKLLMQDIDRQQELARIDALLAVTLDEQQRKNLERRKLEYNATSRTAITNNSDITAANAAVTKSATSLGNLGDDARLRADIAAQTQWKEYIRQEIAKSNTDLSNARQRLTELKPEEANKRMQIEANVAGLIARLELLGQASQKADAAIDAFQQQLANTQPVVKLWENTAEQIAQEQQDAFAKAYKQYLWKTYSVVGDDIYNSSQAERTKHSKDQETARLAMVKAGEGLSETERKQIEIDVMQQMRAGWYLKQKGRLQGEEEKNALALVDTTLTAEKREALEKEKKNITTRIKVADKWDKYLEKAVGEVEKLLQEGFTPEEKLRKEQNKAYHDALKDSARKMRTAVSQQFFTVDKDGNPLSAETIEANKTRYKTEWEAAKQKVGETAEPLTEADAAVIARDTFRGFVKSWMGDLSDLQKKLEAATDDNTKADLTRRIDALKEAIATVHAQYEAAAANVEQYGTPEDYRQQYNKYSRKKLEENLERQYDTYFEKHNTVDKDGNAYTAEQMAQKQQKADSKLHEAVQAYNESLEPLSDADATIIARDTYKKFITQWEGNIVKLEKKMATEADANKKEAMQRQVDALRETIDKVRPIYDQTVADAEQYETAPVSGGASADTPVEKVVKRQTRTILKDNKDLQDALVAREKAWLDSQEKVRGGEFYSTLRDANLFSGKDQERYDYYYKNEYTDKKGNKFYGSIQEYATFKAVAEAKAENLASQLEEKDAEAFKKVREASLIESIDYLEKQWKSALASADDKNNKLVANPDDPRLKAEAQRYTDLANDIQTRIGTLKNDLGVLQAQMKAEGIATQVTKDKAAGKDQPQVEDTAARKNARERAGRNLERDERNISNKEMELENAKNIRRWGYYTQERAALETAVQAQVVGFTDKDGKHIDSEVERIAKSYGMEVEAIKTVKAALVDLDKAYAEHTKVEDAQAEVDAKQNVVNDLDGKIKAAGKRYEKATTDVERTSIEKEQEDLQTRKGKAEEELQKSQEEFDKVVENLTVKTVQAASDAVEVAEQKVIAASINALEEQMANADSHLNDLEQRAKTAAERYNNFMNDENNKSDLALIRSTNPADQAKVSPARRKELEEQLAFLQKTKEETRQAADAERERQQQERTGLMENVQQYRALQTETGRLAEEKKQAAERAEKERRVADLLIAGYADAERAASEWDAKLSEYHEAAKNRIKTETELTKAQRDLEDFDAKHPKEVIISEADLAAQRKELEDNVALAKQNFETADNAARAAREAELAIREQGNVSKAELKEQLALMQSMLETGHLDEEQRNTLNKTIAETEQRIKRLSNIMFSEQETLDIFAGAEDALQRYNKGMDITVGEMKALHEQTMQVANDETQTIQRREQALAIAKQMQNALNGKGTSSADGMNLKQFDDEQVEKIFTSATETLRRYNEGQEVTVLEMKNMHEQIGTLVNDDYQLMDTHKKAIAIQKQYADALNKANVSKETPAEGVSLKQFESYQVEKMFTSADGVLQRYRDGMEVTVLEIQKMRDQMQALANDEYQTIQTHQQAIDVTRQLTDALNARKVAEKPTKSMNQIRSIINKGEKATVDEINEAIKSLKILKDNGSITAQEFQKLDGKIKKLEQTLRGDKVKYSKNFVQHIMDTIDSAPVEDLQKALKQVEAHINEVERGQTEYTNLADDYKKLNKQIEEHNKALGKTKDHIDRNNESWKKHNDWLTTNIKKLANYLGIFGGFYLVRQELQKAWQANIQYSDSLTNIQKTTRLTAEAVAELAENIKNIDTRTSLDGITNMAYAAGRLGVKGVNDIMGFTRAANYLSVALGEQLGDGTASVEQLMKVTEIMGTTEEFGLEDALVKTGSAINELTMNTVASGQPIVDFLRRVSGVGTQAGVTTAQLTGLGAAVNALGQNVEMSATSISKMMVQISSNSKVVAKALKLTAAETDRFIHDIGTGNMMNALMTVLQKVREGGGLSHLGTIAKDLGSEGQRVIQTIATLASNYDKVREMVDMSSAAFENGTSVINEYNLKNQNTAALWERLQNKFSKMFVSTAAIKWIKDLLKRLQDLPEAVMNIVNGFKPLVWVFDGLVAVVTKCSVAVTTLLQTLALNSAWNIAAIHIAKWTAVAGVAGATTDGWITKLRLARSANEGFIASLKKADILSKKNVFLAIAGALLYLINKFREVRAEQHQWIEEVDKEVSSSLNKTKSQAQATGAAMADMLKRWKEANDGTDQRRSVIAEMNNAYGDYLDNLITERDLYQDIDVALKSANAQMEQKAILDAKKEASSSIRSEYGEKIGFAREELIEQIMGVMKNPDMHTAALIAESMMNDVGKYVVEKRDKNGTLEGYEDTGIFGAMPYQMTVNMQKLMHDFGITIDGDLSKYVVEKRDKNGTLEGYEDTGIFGAMPYQMTVNMQKLMHDFGITIDGDLSKVADKLAAWGDLSVEQQRRLDRSNAAFDRDARLAAEKALAHNQPVTEAEWKDVQSLVTLSGTKTAQYDEEQKKWTGRYTQADWDELYDIMPTDNKARLKWVDELNEYIKTASLTYDNLLSIDQDQADELGIYLANAREALGIFKRGKVENKVDMDKNKKTKDSSNEFVESLMNKIRDLFERERHATEKQYMSEEMRSETIDDIDIEMNKMLHIAMDRILGRIGLDEYIKARKRLTELNNRFGAGDLGESVIRLIESVGDPNVIYQQLRMAQQAAYTSALQNASAPLSAATATAAGDEVSAPVIDVTENAVEDLARAGREAEMSMAQSTEAASDASVAVSEMAKDSISLIQNVCNMSMREAFGLGEGGIGGHFYSSQALKETGNPWVKVDKVAGRCTSGPWTFWTYGGGINLPYDFWKADENDTTGKGSPWTATDSVLSNFGLEEVWAGTLEQAKNHEYESVLKPGDIAVMYATSKSKAHPNTSHGVMYNGQEWVSDGYQGRNAVPGNYITGRAGDRSFVLYRNQAAQGVKLSDAQNVRWVTPGQMAAPENTVRQVQVTKDVLDMQDNIKQAMDYFIKELGITVEQAAGMVGVLFAESGMNPASYNKAEKAGTFPGSSANGPGYGAGLAQWSDTKSWQRKTPVLEHINSVSDVRYTAIEDTDLATQLEAIVWELKTTRERTLAQLKLQPNSTSAADVMLRGFENGTSAGLATPAQIDAYTWSDYGKGGYHGAMFGGMKNDRRVYGRADRAAMAQAVYEGKAIATYDRNLNGTIDFDSDTNQFLAQTNGLMDKWAYSSDKYQTEVFKIQLKRMKQVHDALMADNPIGQITEQYQQSFEKMHIMLADLRADSKEALEQKVKEAMEAYLELGTDNTRWDLSNQEDLDEYKFYLSQINAFSEQNRQLLADDVANGTHLMDDTVREIYYRSYEYARAYEEAIAKLADQHRKRWEQIYKQDSQVYQQHVDDQKALKDLLKLEEQIQFFGGSSRIPVQTTVDIRVEEYKQAYDMWQNNIRQAERDLKTAQENLKATQANAEKVLGDENATDSQKKSELDSIASANDRVNAAEQILDKIKKQPDEVTRAAEAMDNAIISLRENTWRWLADIEKGFEKFADSFVELRGYYYDDNDKDAFFNHVFGTREDRQKAFDAFITDLKKTLHDEIIERTKAAIEAKLIEIKFGKPGADAATDGESVGQQAGSNLAKQGKDEALKAAQKQSKKFLSWLRRSKKEEQQIESDSANAITDIQNEGADAQVGIKEGVAKAVGQIGDQALAKGQAQNAAMAGSDLETAETQVTAGIAAGSAKTIADLGWWGLPLIAVISAALSALLNAAFNTIGHNKKTSSTKTKLVSGMLTYDAGNVQSFRGVRTLANGAYSRSGNINMLPVMGDDGKVYMVPEGDLMGDNGMSDYTGMVNRPTLTNVGGQPALVGERGPEMVIGRETTQAMMMSRPDLIQQILEFDRNRSRGFAKTFDRGTSGSINNEQLTMNNDGTSQQELLAMLDANAAMMQQMAAVISRLSDQADEGFGVKMYGENGVGNASAKYMADARRMGNNKYVSRLFGK